VGAHHDLRAVHPLPLPADRHADRLLVQRLDEHLVPPVRLHDPFYEAAFENEQVRNSFWASIKIAAGTAVITTAIAVLVSYALARRKMRFKPLISAFILLPLVVPTVVLGIALLILFKPNGPVLPIPLGLWAVLIGHIVFPPRRILLRCQLASIDRRREAALNQRRLHLPASSCP
jgi:ABC-type spermidine/putrescine transport system permease subunit II